MWADDSITVVWRRELDTTGLDGRDTRCVEHGYCNRGGPAFSIMAAELGAGAAGSRPTARTLFTDTRRGYPDVGYGAHGMHLTTGAGVLQVLHGGQAAADARVVGDGERAVLGERDI